MTSYDKFLIILLSLALSVTFNVYLSNLSFSFYSYMTYNWIFIYIRIFIREIDMLKATFFKDDISRGNLCSRIAITLHVHDVALFSKNNFPVLKFLARYRVCRYIYVHMYAYRCIFPLNPTYLPRASAFHEFHRGFYFFQSSILSYVSCHFAFNFFSRIF